MQPVRISPIALVLVVMATGCRNSPAESAKPAAPAKVENVKAEGDLTTITLTAEAERHLGIKTENVAIQDVRSTRTVGGEAAVPAGTIVVVTAPTAGTLAAPADRSATLGPVARNADDRRAPAAAVRPRMLRADAERDVQEAEARLTEADAAAAAARAAAEGRIGQRALRRRSARGAAR